MFNIQAQKINSSNLEAQFNQSTCIYRNETEFVQIIRIAQINHTFFERTVFPNQCIQFAAPLDALLEIYESVMFSSIHTDTIPCSQIAIVDMDMDMGRSVCSAKELRKDILVASAA
jgi:hypothetical protein